MLKKTFLIFLSFSLFISCEKDEDHSPFPVIETVGAQLLSSGGVKLEGNISNLGDEKILDYGFELFTSEGTIHYNVSHHAELPARSGVYYVEIKQDLYPDLKYDYAAYVTTEKKTYKGERLQFVSNGSATPIMEKCTPNTTHIGDIVTLSGKNFPTDKNDIEFKYAGSYAEIISITENEIKFKVPRPSGSARTIEIAAYDNKVYGDGLLAFHTPIISNVTPDSAFFGETITIKGDHFELNVDFARVEIGGFRAEVVSASRNQIEIIIPEEVNYSNSVIKVEAQGKEVDYNKFLLASPKLISVPSTVYTNDYFDVIVDRTLPKKNKFIINGDEVYPDIVDDQTLRFYLGLDYENFGPRENQIIWRINDRDIVSETPIVISNPFYRIGRVYDQVPFTMHRIFTNTDKGLVLGNTSDSVRDNRILLYEYDDVTNNWAEKSQVLSNGELIPVSLYSSVATLSEYSDQIYVLNSRGYFGQDFIKIDTQTGNALPLASVPTTNDDFGIGFSYSNKVYFTTGAGLNEIWMYTIDTDEWQSNITEIPFSMPSGRGDNLNAIVLDNYVYLSNGIDGTSYTDFWRLNLDSLDWEKLADNPNPKRKTTVYKYGDELHFVNDHTWRYNVRTNVWSEMDNPGIETDTRTGVFESFVQKGIPYVIDNSIRNVGAAFELYLYKGDFVR